MSEFNVEQREQGTVSVLDIQGYLDAHTAPKLEDAFQSLISTERYNIVVNCRDLSYISSAGLGVFMAFIEEVRKNEGEIKLTSMTPKVFNVFDLLGFPLLYDITDEESDAIGKFTEKGG